MKKTLLILAALAFILVPSCTKQVEEEPESEDLLENVGEEGGEQQGGAVEFEATLLETKTHLGDPDGAVGSRKWPNLWSAGDVINVNGVYSTSLTGAGTNYAIFTMKDAVSAVGGKYYSAYPNAKVSSWNSGSKTATVTIPATQTFTSGNYDPSAYIMVGSSNTKKLDFSPVMGLIQLTTTAPAEGTLYIKSITVEPVGDEKMSGSFTTDYSAISASGSATSSVTISANTGSGSNATKAFSTVFTFAIPAQNYASGVRFRIVANTASNGGGTDKTMVYAKQSAFTVAAGTLYPLTAPAFKESAVTINSVTAINSSTLGLSWTGANANNNKTKAWKIHVYSDSGCSTEIRTISIPKNAACWTSGMTSSVNFAIGGLSANTTYYFKVEDVQSGITSAQSNGKTAAFTLVGMTSIGTSTTGTVFAEDFRELCGFGVKYNGVEYGGCINNNAAKRLDASDWASVSFVAPEDYNWKLYSSDLDAGVAGKRLAGWLSERQVIAKCGYLQLGSEDAKGWVLTPAFTLADGYMAKVNVTINAAKYDASTIAQSISVVRPGKAGSGTATRESDYSWGDTPDPATYDGEKNPSGIVWQDVTASGLYLRNGDRIMFGSAQGSADTNQRILMNSIKVEVVEVVPEADYLISCYERLKGFMDAVGKSAGSGTKSATGRVTHDISLTSSQKTSLASHYPLAAYTGTLNGGSKTITGLTQPLFDDLQGTVKDLNLTSVISVSNIARAGVGILANSLSAGHVEGCSVTGSLTVSYSESASPNATCYAGGIVGQVNTGDVTDSENSADITVSGTAKSNLYIGGVVANNTASSFSLEDCHSTGGTISYSGTNPSGALYIGGVVGYSKRPVSGCSSAMNINVGGTFAVDSGNSYYATGGIVGSMSANQTISDCTNSGNITYSQQLSAYGYSYVAGIVGRSEGDVTSCTNSGEIKYTGSCLANYSFVGGIIGTAKDGGGTVSGTNTGPITINSTTQTGTNFYVGGVAGRAYGITASNSGSITISRLASATAYVGGIVGDAGNNGVGSGSNTGDIEISNFSASDITYIGGVAGNIRNSTGKVQASNEGNIKLYNTCSSTSGDLLVGGIAGRTTRGVYGVTNSGNINNAMTVASGAWISIGGIAGENSSGSWVGNDGNSNRNNNTGDVTNTANGGGIRIGGIVGNAQGRINNVYNTGDITNGGNSIDTTICVGGIAGITSNNILNASNGTSSAAGGSISNSGTSAQTICVGGVAGKNTGNAFTTCYNKGEVTNSGPAPDSCIVVGGLVGWSDAGSSYVAPCYNTGAISNTGLVGTKNLEHPYEDDWVDVGGLIGLAYGANALGGTSSEYNYNAGTVTENSESLRPYVGGICGEDDVAASDFTHCENRSGGNVTVKNNTRHNISAGGIVGATWYNSTLTCTSNAGNIYVQNITDVNCINVGGILGVTEATPSLSGEDATHRTTNSGDIEFTSCTIHGALRAAGILPWWDTTDASTVEYCTNTGTISTHTKSTSSTDLNITTNGFNYVGGIVGGSAAASDYQYKTIQYCDNNSGHITIYSRGKFRIGGIAAHLSENPQHCTCTANITYARSSYASTDQSQIGGIVGYQIKNRNFVDIHYNGTVSTSGSYCYASGIIGYTGYSTTFDNCSIQGSIQCLDKTPGLFFSNTKSGGYALTCKNGCTVKRGTTLISSSGTTTINSASDFTKTTVVGGTGASNSPTYSNLSVN